MLTSFFPDTDPCIDRKRERSFYPKSSPRTIISFSDENLIVFFFFEPARDDELRLHDTTSLLIVHVTWQTVHVSTRHRVSLAVRGPVRSQRQNASITKHLGRRTSRVAVAQVAVASSDARNGRFTEPVATTRVAEPRLGARARS